MIGRYIYIVLYIGVYEEGRSKIDDSDAELEKVSSPQHGDINCELRVMRSSELLCR